MKHLYLLAAATFLLFAACHKKSAPGAGSYVPGQVIVGLNANVPIESAFALANNAGTPLLNVNFYGYTSHYPADSISSLYTYLDSKPYLDTGYTKYWIRYDSASSTIGVGAMFANMTIAAQEDWINTKKQLALTESNTGDVMLLILVPVGQEQKYINILQESPIVKYACVNGTGAQLF